MNREIIMQALLAKLTSPPLVFTFTADTTTDDVTLTNVSDSSGLMVGMPVAGDGLPLDATIATITPAVTISLPAVADRTATALLQGFQTTARRLASPSAEQDMPSLYLIEVGELHETRPSTQPAIVELQCEAWVYTKVGADENAVSIATLNTLIDGIERALYPTPQAIRQNLGVNGVLYCRIEGEIAKDPGHKGELAGAVIPLKIAVGQSAETYLL